MRRSAQMTGSIDVSAAAARRLREASTAGLALLAGELEIRDGELRSIDGAPAPPGLCAVSLAASRGILILTREEWEEWEQDLSSSSREERS